MTYRLDDTRYRHETVTVRTLWLTIALSLLIHLAALFLWLPRMRSSGPGDEAQKMEADRLQVRLAAIAKPAPEQTPGPSREKATTPKPPARQPTVALRARPPPVMVAPTPAAPAVPTPPSTTPPATAPPRTGPPLENDLWAYVEARRRERGERQGAPIGNPRADPNASIAANLPTPSTGVAARERKGGGGIFEIKRMTYDDAAFEFFGWNNEMRRETPQLIEVRLGDNSDMRIAVVRKMIAIIREHSKGDFVWRSPRHENGLVLSARRSDNAELENFLMHDFFDNARQVP